MASKHPGFSRRMRLTEAANPFASVRSCWVGEEGLRLGDFLPIPKVHGQETRFVFQTTGVVLETD